MVNIDILNLNPIDSVGLHTRQRSKYLEPGAAHGQNFSRGIPKRVLQIPCPPSSFNYLISGLSAFKLITRDYNIHRTNCYPVKFSAHMTLSHNPGIDRPDTCYWACSTQDEQVISHNTITHAVGSSMTTHTCSLRQ